MWWMYLGTWSQASGQHPPETLLRKLYRRHVTLCNHAACVYLLSCLLFWKLLSFPVVVLAQAFVVFSSYPALIVSRCVYIALIVLVLLCLCQVAVCKWSGFKSHKLFCLCSFVLLIKCTWVQFNLLSVDVHDTLSQKIILMSLFAMQADTWQKGVFCCIMWVQSTNMFNHVPALSVV